MTEWGVVGVIIALVGLIASIIKPIISLTKSITELTVVVRELKSDMATQKSSSHETHRRIWEHEGEQDKKISDHETRIGRLEGK